MFLSLTFAQALSTLGEEPQLIFDETIVPKTAPCASHSCYLPEYDWLFLLERKLARFLDPWLKKHRKQLIGSSGLISEALSNAYCHGHKRQAKLPIGVNIYQGNQGILLRIYDTGKGFDYGEMLAKYLNKKNYFYNAGNGMKSMYETDIFGVFYDDNGSSFHLLYLFDESLIAQYLRPERC
ncbi:hypothetical protein SAMN05660420_03071 [Desulfuromusa kysingii]|uniref:Anti-sigma regulatory factor (Ser/Thr protein kinase) n=1 Tax=Desulfuromusa kysingii TaxID=37625 RepID=A0A1H4DSW9_9BACT|nr:hypothetical protein [Desulfuromusa kysingii]SEA75282.1 hypothetical protein SAMN05660420_03071 [Desulfuromusa kysingii]